MEEYEVYKEYEEYKIIDSHAHIFPEKIVEGATANIGHFYDLKMRNLGSSQKLIESGHQTGISAYLVCSVATAPKQVPSINRFIADECKKHPQFIGLGALHPMSENLKEEFQQILSYGLRGIKLHPDFQKFSMDSKEAYRIYALAEEAGLPVLIHFGDSRYQGSAPQAFVPVRRDFPMLKVIAPHLGGYERWEEAQKYLAGMDNLWFDTCSSFAFMSPEKAAAYIRNFGTDRVMFGTDFPMWRHTSELRNLMKLGFTKKENQNILAENFRQLFPILP